MLLNEARPLRLENGQVDIWLTRLHGIGNHLLHKYQLLLSQGEAGRWRKFAVHEAQLQYLVSRALIRTTLSRYFGVSAKSWQFAADRYGRPYITEPNQFRHIQFNLSHTSGLVACALGKVCEIGIDVENIRRDLDFIDLASRFFSPVETSRLLQTRPDGRREMFFCYWTLKEAYIKARGQGLSLGLDGFWLELDGASPRAHFTERCPDDSNRWQFRQYAPTVDHKLALAVGQAKELHVCQRWVVPLRAGEATRDPV